MPVAGTGVQGRGPISDETYRNLPAELIKHGSLLMMGGKVQGFAAVYETNIPSSDGTAKNGSFLFWSVAVSDEVAANVAKMDRDEDKHRAVMQYLATCPLECQLLPEIVSHGLTNIKTVNSTTSQNPGDWRAGREHLGRIIFIGDAIHPMTGRLSRSRFGTARRLLLIRSPASRSRSRRQPSYAGCWSLAEHTQGPLEQREQCRQ